MPAIDEKYYQAARDYYASMGQEIEPGLEKQAAEAERFKAENPVIQPPPPPKPSEPEPPPTQRLPDPVIPADAEVVERDAQGNPTVVEKGGEKYFLPGSTAYETGHRIESERVQGGGRALGPYEGNLIPEGTIITMEGDKPTRRFSRQELERGDADIRTWVELGAVRYPVKSYAGKEVLLTPKQVKEIEKVVDNREQFDLYKKYGVIAKNAKYYTPEDIEAAQREQAMASIDQDRWYRQHTKLPDGQWIANSDLAQVKTDSPEVYQLLTTEGFAAANTYVDAQNKVADVYSKNVAMVKPYEIKEGPDAGKIDIVRLMSSGNEPSIKAAITLFPDLAGDEKGFLVAPKDEQAKAIAQTIALKQIVVEGRFNIQDMGKFYAGLSAPEKRAVISNWQQMPEIEAQLAAQKPEEVKAAFKGIISGVWAASPNWDKLTVYDKAGLIAGDVANTIFIGVGAYQIGKALNLKPPKVILPKGSGGLPTEAFNPKTTLTQFKNIPPYELNMSKVEFDRFIIAKRANRNLTVTSFQLAEENGITFKDAIKQVKTGLRPDETPSRLWQPERQIKTEEVPRRKLIATATIETGLTRAELREFTLARQVNPDLTPKQYVASKAAFNETIIKTGTKAREYEKAFKIQFLKDFSEAKQTGITKASAKVLAQQSFLAYQNQIKEAKYQREAGLKILFETQAKEIPSRRLSRKEGEQILAKLAEMKAQFEMKAQNESRLWKPAPMWRAEYHGVLPEEAITQPQPQPVTAVKAATATALATATQLKTETKTQTRTQLQTQLRAQLQTALMVATQLKTQVKTKTQTKLATQLQTQLKTATQTKAATQTRTALRTALKTATKLQTQLKTEIGLKTALKPVTKIPTKPVTKKPPPKRIRLPGGSKGEKNKRQSILAAGGAIAWRMGKVGGTDRWDTIINPYADNSDYLMVLGEPPEGATIVSRGVGSAYRTAQVTKGQAPKRAVLVDSGFIDVNIKPEGRKQIAVAFTPDPQGLTKGDITIGGGNRAIINRIPPRISSKRLRITPKRPRIGR